MSITLVHEAFPCRPLLDQSPYSCIHPTQPLYLMTPCIFRCSAFLHKFSPNLDKFSQGAVKCIFLVILGSKRLSTGNHTPIVISDDVTLFEDTPYFSTSINLTLPSNPFPSPILPNLTPNSVISYHLALLRPLILYRP